ncbi:SpdD protein [Streptomyces griseoviridis]
MFLPKYPDNPTPPPTHTHAPTYPAPAPVRRSLPSISLDQKTVAAVLAGGVLLTALLAAVAVTAVSVAVTAVVLRSLLRDHHRR